MCGRYVSSSPLDVLVDYFEIADVEVPELPPSWNVAPTREVYAVSTTREEGTRRLGSLRWGLVPSWAEDPSVGSRFINARAESVAEKPAFRRALSVHRCLVPADGFYEWELREHKKTKQPWLVTRADGAPMAFAGLWEAWRDAEGGWLRTCAIVTTESTGQLADIHDRCPVILERDVWDTWLDRGVTEESEVVPMLGPNPPELLALHPVGRRVNDVRNDDETLVEPVVPEPDAPTLF